MKKKHPRLLKTKLDKEQFLDWIGVLQSEAIPQTRKFLEDSGGMCCLGVAVSLTSKNPPCRFEGWGIRLVGGSPGDNQGAPGWLKRINIDFLNRSGRELISLNDKDKLTFPQIADKLLEVYGEELK